MDTVNEMGKLHPRSFNFVSQGIPVSWKILNTSKNAQQKNTVMVQPYILQSMSYTAENISFASFKSELYNYLVN